MLMFYKELARELRLGAAARKEEGCDGGSWGRRGGDALGSRRTTPDPDPQPDTPAPPPGKRGGDATYYDHRSL
ncbi:hypothetical protein E2C01_033529 [Portunus trituberculatus]|uniref:Uncharacterized protein n=1 Tax=Portunus trituberculatus TaxID=210409 RepID=A0A5B7F3P0_PORTR|nr:hypothetical protein [Portunus trituberculatus]